ncbi:MAG TPA: hypothetical protein VKO86_03460 [Gemmatimonadales bacterium]|nr:hypothetical protein [Gemmatimonadales bacterium]
MVGRPGARLSLPHPTAKFKVSPQLEPRGCGMSITYTIDHARRLVTAVGQGDLTGDDIFGYQQEVWSRPDVGGYDELIDMTNVQRIDLRSVDHVKQLAELAASMDPVAVQSKFAIVAPDDYAFGLGRMYESYRRLEGRSTKRVGVFRSMAEARAFLEAAG